MKNKKDFEKYLHSIINKFIPILLLQQHVFCVKYGVENKSSYFECVFNYPYLNVTILYSQKSFEDWINKKDMTEFVVHEMCHPITDPMYAKAISRYVSQDEIRDEREKLTDLICNIALQRL